MTEPDYDLAFRLAPIGLVLTRDRRMAVCNDHFATMFGYDQAALKGQMTAMLYPSHQDFVEIGRFGRAEMLKEGQHSDERIMKRQDGSLFWCHVEGRAEDPAHPFQACVWAFSDLSDRRPAMALTARERQVAMMLMRGMDTKEMARDLGLSPRTVEIHRSNLLRKHGVRTTLELLSLLSTSAF